MLPKDDENIIFLIGNHHLLIQAKTQKLLLKEKCFNIKYLPMHPTARLSSTEKTQLINGLSATLNR
jgi:hypothetical protein